MSLEAPIAQSVEHWTCDWKVIGSDPRSEGPYWTISIFLALCLSEATNPSQLACLTEHYPFHQITLEISYPPTVEPQHE